MAPGRMSANSTRPSNPFSTSITSPSATTNNPVSTVATTINCNSNMQTPISTSTARVLTKAQQLNMVTAFVERIYPQVSDTNLLLVCLQRNNWDFETSVAEYAFDREKILDEEDEENINRIDSQSTVTDPSVLDPEDNLRSGWVRQQTDQRAMWPNQPTSHVVAATPKQPERRIPLWANRNIEQERRDAALALKHHFEHLHDPEVPQLTASEAVLLLHRAQWVFTTAIKEFQSLSDARNTVHDDYDRMRTKLPTKPINKKNLGDVESQQLREQDERLANFVNITARSDWYSLKMFLQKRHWNLVAAIEGWFYEGVRPVAPSAKERVNNFRYDANMRPLAAPSGEDWVPEPSFDDTWSLDRDIHIDIVESMSDVAGSEMDSDEDSVQDPDSGKGNGKRKGKGDQRQGGFLLNELEGTAKPGLRNDWRFLHEHIAKGRYWANRFKDEKRFWWPELVPEILQSRGYQPPKGAVMFDWNNQEHLNLLNNFRRQNSARSTGTGLREPAQTWSEEEKDFLYQLNLEWLYDQRKKAPAMAEVDLLKKKITGKTKQEWRDRLNARFVGTIQPGSSEPRRERGIIGIMSQRSRTPAIVERFQLKPDMVYFQKKQNQAEKQTLISGTAKKRSVDEAFSDASNRTAPKYSRVIQEAFEDLGIIEELENW